MSVVFGVAKTISSLFKNKFARAEQEIPIRELCAPEENKDLINQRKVLVL